VSVVPVDLPRVQASPFRRARALVAVAERTVKTGWASRIGRLYAFGIAISHPLVVGWLAHGDSQALAAAVPLALTWISWAVGLAALSSARDLSRAERRNGVFAASKARGADALSRRRATVVATMLVLARSVGLPGVLTVGIAFAVARSAGGGIPVLSFALGVIGYALVYGIVLGGLSRWAAALSPRHGRFVFAALVLGPWLLRDVVPDVPSVVSALAALLRHVAAAGGGPTA
jgi:hypothetical protein